MKKILFTLAAAAMVLGAASCQKENLGQIKEVKTVDNPLNTITVVCGADTRLAIDENLTPVFEVDDVIFGWDSEGTAYAYTCTEVTEDAATFTRTSSGAPSADEGTVVNLVYAPGYEIEDIVDKTLDVNLAVQGETLPVVMHTSGTVDEEGVCMVTFLNDVAIVDVKDAVLPDAVEDEEYTVSFHGKNTSLKFTLDEDGSLVVAPASEGPISSSEKAKVSADSKISKKFAVPASLEATDVIITATAADGSSYAFSAGSKNIVAGKYITVAGKEFTLQYVAEVGGVGYPTLAKAVEAANAATDDVTIKMLNDASSSSSVNINNANGKKVTLDLNGCTVSSQIIVTTDFEVADATGKGVVEADTYTIKIGEENKGVTASFILNGGTVKALDDNYAIAADGTNNGAQPTVLIKKGTLVAANGSATRTRYASMTFGDETEGEITVNSKNGLWISYTTDVVINKGSFVSTARIAYFGNSSSGATFNGGTFTTEGSGFAYNSDSVNPSFEILGGFFTWDGTKDFVQQANNEASVKGGYFSSKLPNMCVATGYICKESSTYEGYPYEVAVNEDKSIIKVGDEKFETLAEALAKINSATTQTTMQILANIDLASTDSLVFSNEVTDIILDLNGKVISSAASESGTLLCTTAKNLTISDSQGEGTLDLSIAANGQVVHVAGGNCNITGGKFTHSKGTGYYNRNSVRVDCAEASATLNISGGEFSAGGRVIVYGGNGSDKKAYVNISGGLIKARTTSKENSSGTTSYVDNNDYAVIRQISTYSYMRITGGTIYAYYQPAIYMGNANSTITIERENDSVPYFFQKYPDWAGVAGGANKVGKLFKAGSKTGTALSFNINECYTNAKNVNYSEILSHNNTDVKEVTGIKDSYDNSYTYQFYKVQVDN